MQPSIDTSPLISAKGVANITFPLLLLRAASLKSSPSEGAITLPKSVVAMRGFHKVCAGGEMTPSKSLLMDGRFFPLDRPL